MTDTKILRAILSGQSASKQELLNKIEGVDKKLDKGFKNINEKIEKTIERLDKIGKGVAYLEDDTPTIDEFNKLVRRVLKLENRVFKD